MNSEVHADYCLVKVGCWSALSCGLWAVVYRPIHLYLFPYFKFGKVYHSSYRFLYVMYGS